MTTLGTHTLTRADIRKIEEALEHLRSGSHGRRRGSHCGACGSVRQRTAAG